MHTIHTIGNSHAAAGFDQIAGIQCHVLGPKLMYSLGRDGIDFKNYGIENGDTVILCTGEIDCRCHIHNYKDNYVCNITNVVTTYINAIIKNLEYFNNLKVCVYSVTPPCRGQDIKGHHKWPILGNDEDRKTYTVWMNKLLKEECIKNNLIFFDVYDKYSCKEGFLNKELSNQGHITNPIYIKEFIDNNNL